MGVPKFFRYISERYPCLSEKLKEYQIPEFDNLYLDMNGIIHNCSHPNDADVSFRITEEDIFKNIFHYIEILFRIIQPQKLFFMAVDGVAPRAKINQQRGRRFRAAKDAELQEMKAKAKGQEIPKAARFDSNCITPGTEFMAQLNEQLKYFVTYKMSTDENWQKCKIILSGPEVPGEGEHKIMDYIRYMKAQPDYDGNVRHCLYGLDADLIMLGLCSHEPHFSLLREEVKFGKTQKKILTPEETNFCLLHLSLMREYLEHEFSPVASKLKFEYDVEKIIDDWVLMGFLVGNDFIPHLPNLHIENNALTILYNAYMDVLPTLDGYINEAGTLNLARFEKFMEKLGQYDMEQFDEIYADLKYFEAKTGRRMYDNGKGEKIIPEETMSPAKTSNHPALANLILATENELGDDEDDESEESDDTDVDMKMEFVLHKRDYYMSKMEYEHVDAETMRSQAEGYIRAIQWNLHYYYNGCCSWSWYYPHHYAPFISDIKNFKDLKIDFDLGEPFLPFQQLLAVLPAASKALLPKAYHNLMTEENSPIIKYYPVDFKTDLNGKRQEWEAVVLIPLIDETSLIEAMEPCNEKLTEEEKKRNRHGPMAIFTHSKKNLGIYKAPQYFPDIRRYAKMQLIQREEILVPIEKLVKGLCKGVKLSVYYPGFPTLQHVPHTATLAKAKVKVFEQPSRRENMILRVLPKKEIPLLNDIAQKYLGKTVFIGWPHLVEAYVVGVSTVDQKISIVHPSQQKGLPEAKLNFCIEEANDSYVAGWKVQRKHIIENYKSRLGIEVGETEVLVHACPMVGRQYVYSSQGKMTLEKQWNEISVPYAYQVVLLDLTVHNQDFIQFTSIVDVYKPKSTCFMLGHPHYGAMGEVTEQGVDLKTSRIKVAMRAIPEPNFQKARQLQHEAKPKYMPGNIAAQRLGISSHLLSRITGCIFVVSCDAAEPGRTNLGLNLKFNKKNEEVIGFTKKDNNGAWLYSAKTVSFLDEYMGNFPELVEQIDKNLVSSDVFQKEDLFSPGLDYNIETVAAWLKEQQKALGTQTRVCGTEEIEDDVVKMIEQEVEELDTNTSRTVLMQVKPHLLYKPGLNTGSLPPDPRAYHRLFDRVVCVRNSFTVPLGYKGTIIGIQKADTPAAYVYEVLFDEPFAGGLVIHNCSPNRGYRLACTDFINITYGQRAEDKNAVKSNLPAQQNWRTQPQSQPKQSALKQPQIKQVQLKQNQPKQIQVKQSQSLQRKLQSPATTATDFKMAPDPSILNSIHPKFSKDVKNEKQQQIPKILQRPPDAKKKESQQKPTVLKKEDESQYQAIWNELNSIQDQKQVNAVNEQIMQIIKSSPQHKVPAKLQTSVKSDVKSDSLMNEKSSTDTPQDPSAFLKAMLKISDDSPNTSTHSSHQMVTTTASTVSTSQNIRSSNINSSSVQDAPPLVQQLFEKARKDELNQGNIFYSTRILSYYQLLGQGFPRYIYLNKDNLVSAQIILPDMRVFQGDYVRSHSAAAESVAKKVYEELQLDKIPYPPNIARSSASPMPQPSPTRQPSQQLQQKNYQAPQWFNRPPIPAAGARPMLPAGFPPVSLMQIPMPKWSPQCQQGPGFVQMSHSNNPQQTRFPQPPFQQQNMQIPPQQMQQQQQSMPMPPQHRQQQNISMPLQQMQQQNMPMPSQQMQQQQQQQINMSMPQQQMQQQNMPMPPQHRQQQNISMPPQQMQQQQRNMPMPPQHRQQPSMPMLPQQMLPQQNMSMPSKQRQQQNMPMTAQKMQQQNIPSHQQLQQNQVPQKLQQTQKVLPQSPQFQQVQQNQRKLSPSQTNRKKSTPFVPLQAQKKTRKQHISDEMKPSKDKDKKDNKSSSPMEQKLKSGANKEEKQDKQSSNKSNEHASQNNQAQNNASKGQKSNAQRQRRSRVAAKFMADPMANGSDRH
ncbi:5'-3' exoribonuclease 1 isoform X1 [Trichogramma pretiosum]|uniref:5'-3' exoribonuclease 1 isoform X1 n=1 Tax=Trichogramma pretiosum TaxID=7493 RepID=UPI0006C957DC|nr:5'-3' exoribonuclease 1 isoform X1 [Trichogramma pretiosum]